MKDLSHEHFFSLSSFAYKDLFLSCRYVWEALPKIKEFILSFNLGTINSTIPSGCILENEPLILIEEGVEIEPQTYIKGPCVLLKGAKVRQGAYIRENVIVGPRSVVGHATEIKNSVLLENAHAAHFAYVGDSILGNNTNLGAGTKCANLKFNGSSIRVKVGNKVFDTGLKKFGAILGDGAQTGCNSVTNPGTLIDPGCIILPCSSVQGHICEENAPYIAKK